MENLARIGRKCEMDKIQANSIQLKPSGWPNDTELHRGCELGSSCEYRLAIFVSICVMAMWFRIHRTSDINSTE